jgi:hypothetical protein
MHRRPLLSTLLFEHFLTRSRLIGLGAFHTHDYRASKYVFLMPTLVTCNGVLHALCVRVGGMTILLQFLGRGSGCYVWTGLPNARPFRSDSIFTGLQVS